MAEIEIGLGKSGRRAYGFDDIAIVPSRRTRDPEDVDIAWQIDAFRFELPVLGSAMDGVVSPATAIEIGRLGGAGVLNLEGLWTRYEDPEPLFEEIAHLDVEKATRRMQEIYAVVDVSRLMARRFGDSSALDEYLRVALLLGTAAEQRGDRFGVILFHREVSRFLRARNGKAHYAACRAAMFDAQPEPVPADFFELAAFLRSRVPKRSLLFLLTALDEPSAALSLDKAATLLGKRHLPYVVMLQPGGVAPVMSGPDTDLYAGLAGHLQWRALRELEVSLRTHGVRFHMVQPGALAAKVLGLYDEVKQRQLL